jgi:hypothetical protein
VLSSSGQLTATPAGTGTWCAAGITTHGPITGVHCVSRKHSRVAAADVGTGAAKTAATRQTGSQAAGALRRRITARSFALAGGAVQTASPLDRSSLRRRRAQAEVLREIRRRSVSLPVMARLPAMRGPVR